MNVIPTTHYSLSQVVAASEKKVTAYGVAIVSFPQADEVRNSLFFEEVSCFHNLFVKVRLFEKNKPHSYAT